MIVAEEVIEADIFRLNRSRISVLAALRTIGMKQWKTITSIRGRIPNLTYRASHLIPQIPISALCFFAVAAFDKKKCFIRGLDHIRSNPHRIAPAISIPKLSNAAI